MTFRTSQPRLFPSEGQRAGVVLQQRYFVHLQTCHPDYYRWRVLSALLCGPVIVGGIFIVAVMPSLFYVAFLPLLAVCFIGSVVVPRILYHRRYFAPRGKYNEELHENVMSLPQMGEASLNKCDICRENVPIELGVQHGLLGHYKRLHPKYYLWTLRTRRIFPQLTILAFGIMFTLLLASREALFLPVAIGFTLFLLLFGIGAARAGRESKRLWRETEHGSRRLDR